MMVKAKASEFLLLILEQHWEPTLNNRSPLAPFLPSAAEIHFIQCNWQDDIKCLPSFWEILKIILLPVENIIFFLPGAGLAHSPVLSLLCSCISSRGTTSVQQNSAAESVTSLLHSRGLTHSIRQPSIYSCFWAVRGGMFILGFYHLGDSSKSTNFTQSSGIESSETAHKLLESTPETEKPEECRSKLKCR